MFFMILGVLAIVAIGLTACNGPTGPIDFEDPPLGANYYVLDTFTDSGFTMTILPFQWGNGQWTFDMYATVMDQGMAGGTGQEIWLNNVNLRFIFCDPVEGLSLNFGDHGGNLNIEINSDFVNFGYFTDIDGTTIGNVDVSAVIGAGGATGKLTLKGKIKTFFIGGQARGIDDVSLSQ